MQDPCEWVLFQQDLEVVLDRVATWLSAHIGVDFDKSQGKITGVARRGPAFCRFEITGELHVVKFTNLSGCVVLLLHFWRHLKEVIAPSDQFQTGKSLPFPPMSLAEQDVAFLVHAATTQCVDVAQQSLQILASVATSGPNNAQVISKNFPGAIEWLLKSITLKWQVLPVEAVHRMCELLHCLTHSCHFEVSDATERNIDFCARQFASLDLRAARQFLLDTIAK